MVGMRAVTRAVAVLVASSLLAACLPDQSRPTPTPSPTPTGDRPRFELSTYMYAVQTKGKLRVAVRDGAAPLSARSASGRYDGLEPDLARELARAIWGRSADPDARIEWVPVDDSTRVAALTSNQADVTVAGIAASDDVSKTIDLTETYLVTGPRLLVKKTNDEIKEVADVATGEQTVCALPRSRAREDLSRVTSDRAKILELSTLDFCLQALSGGAADAIADDEVVLFGLVLKDPNLKVVGRRYADDRLAVGVKKNANGDRQRFLEFVNDTLRALVADGTWARLYERSFATVTAERKKTPAD